MLHFLKCYTLRIRSHLPIHLSAGARTIYFQQICCNAAVDSIANFVCARFSALLPSMKSILYAQFEGFRTIAFSAFSLSEYHTNYPKIFFRAIIW